MVFRYDLNSWEAPNCSKDALCVKADEGQATPSIESLGFFLERPGRAPHVSGIVELAFGPQVHHIKVGVSITERRHGDTTSILNYPVLEFRKRA